MSGEIVHRGLVLLKVSEASVLDEIGAVVDLSSFVIGRISETEVVIDPARMGELSSLLAERGLAPLVKKARSAASVREWSGEDETRPVGRRRRR